MGTYAPPRPPQVRRLAGTRAGAACGATEVPRHPEPSSGLAAALHPVCAALLHPPPELRGALLPLHRGRRSLSYATKSPRETTPPSKIPFFPPPLGAPFCPSAGILGPALAPDSAPRPFTSRGLHCLRAWNGYFGLPHFSGGRGSIFFSYFLLVIFFLILGEIFKKIFTIFNVLLSSK